MNLTAWQIGPYYQEALMCLSCKNSSICKRFWRRVYEMNDEMLRKAGDGKE